MGRMCWGAAICVTILAAGPAAGQDFELPAGDAEPEDIEPAERGEPLEAPRAPEPEPVKAPRTLAPTVAAAALAPAPAAGVLAVALADTPQMAEWAANLGPKLTEALARRLPAKATHLEAALDPEVDARRARRRAEARADILEGLEAFEALDLERASAVLQDAVEGLLSELSGLDGTERSALARGVFALAATTLFEGDTERADQQLVALAALEPGFQPDAGRYPSNVRQRFERLRGRMATHNTGGLAITSLPAGAEVYVDGGLRGRTPLTLNGIAEGSHALTLQHPAHAPEGRLITVQANEVLPVQVQLVGGPGVETYNGLTGAQALEPRVAARSAGRLGVQRLALLRVGGSVQAPQVRGVWVHGAQSQAVGRIEGVSLSPDPEFAVAQLVLAILQSEAPQVVATPVEAPQGELTSRWWFWVAVGSAAVLAAATTTWAVTRGEPGGPPRSTAVLGF